MIPRLLIVAGIAGSISGVWLSIRDIYRDQHQREQEYLKFEELEASLKEEIIKGDKLEQLFSEAASNRHLSGGGGLLGDLLSGIGIVDLARAMDEPHRKIYPVESDAILSQRMDYSPQVPQQVGAFCATSIGLAVTGNPMPVGTPCRDHYGNSGMVVAAAGMTTFAQERPSSVDLILHRMQLANIAFNAPSVIAVDDPAQIELLLGIKQSVEELKNELEADITAKRLTGYIEVASIKASPTVMQAELEGSAFIIKSLTPKEQIISSETRTEWDWEVTPKRSGKNIIFLTVNARLPIDGGSAYRTVKTFKKEIAVESPPTRRRALKFIQDTWQWLWTALLIPFGSWMLKKREPSIKQNNNKINELLRKRRGNQ